MNKPFVHIIESPYKAYAYDVNTDCLVPISNELAKYIKLIQQSEDIKASEEVKSEIEKLNQYGFLKSKHPSIIEDPRIDDIEYLTNYRLEQLVLQVTQQCNLRCSYCSFTYSDNVLNRSHTANCMTWEVAQKAIDFFAERCKDTNSVNIGFYGGEPLLQYELVKKAIEYAKIRLEGKELSFTMTTNAMLLTPEKLKYLVTNHTNVMISLDGPKSIHNKGRKLALDGKGSFDTVFNSLSKLKKECPEYFKEVSFNCVLDPLNSLEEVEDFFKQDIFDKKSINTPIMEPCTGSKIFYTEDFNRQYFSDTLLALLSIQGIIEDDDLGVLSKNMKGSMISFKKTLLNISELNDRMGHGGPCMPGIRNLFVSFDGQFYPCEKVSEIEATNLGNLTTGYNYTAIKERLNIGNLTEEKCKNCWALLHCSICLKNAHDENELSSEVAISHCKSSRVDFEGQLKSMIALDETLQVFRKYVAGI